MNDGGRGARGGSQFGHVPRPNKTERPASGISATKNPQQSYQNQNFRKAFNPSGDNDWQGNNMQRQDSYENLDSQFNNINSRGINLPN